MSKQTRIWLVVAILHTFYLFFVLGQGAITSPGAGVVDVFPFGELPYSGYSHHLGIDNVVHFLLFSVTVVWVIWGRLFVREGTWREDHRVRRDGMTGDE